MENKMISISQLSKGLSLNRATLKTWLGHYSLNKYNDSMNAYKVNKCSLRALRKYLHKKDSRYVAKLNLTLKELKIVVD